MKYIFFLTSALFIFTACNKPQAPVFKEIKNLKIGKIQGGTLMLTADAHYYNPNGMKGKLTGTDLEIAIKENKVGVINQAELVKIPANADFIIPLEARLSADFLSKNLFGGVLSMLQEGKVPLYIKGEITVKIVEIPIKIPVDHTEEIRLQDLL